MPPPRSHRTLLLAVLLPQTADRGRSGKPGGWPGVGPPATADPRRHMVVLGLFVRADLENVTDFAAPGDHRWCLDVQESGSAEVKRGVFVSNEEEVEVPGGRGTAHVVLRFQKGGKACSISVREVKGRTRPLTAEDAAPVALVAFECRGCELVGWTPTAGYRCRSTGGTAFEDVDLTEGEWADYDEENDLSVMIENVESSFETIKV